jgi:hypothetical protein
MHLNLRARVIMLAAPIAGVASYALRRNKTNMTNISFSQMFQYSLVWRKKKVQTAMITSHHTPGQAVIICHVDCPDI